jgi:hypothetical protein
MSFSSFDAVFFTAGFLVPGFIWSAVLSMLVPRLSIKAESRVMEFLTLSCINHGVWSWALLLIFRAGPINEQPLLNLWFLFGIVFLSPLGFGLLHAWLQQKEMVARLLRRFGYRPIHSIPTAWDWKFSQGRSAWARVSLKNGSVIYGLFAEGSFAGSDPERRDLFLEAAFRLLDTGDLAPEEDTQGVLIVADQIATIEFRNVVEDADE